MRRRNLIMLGCAIAATACHKTQTAAIDTADNGLANGSVTAESRDARALRDAIRFDPHARHAASTPGHAPTPVVAAAGGGGDACLSRYGGQLRYDRGWAKRLPPELPAPAGATITDAAGHDGGCAIRIVSYAVPGDAEAALGWYGARARAGGYTADRGDTGGDRVLAGTKGAAAYYIMAGPPAKGITPIDLVWAATG